MVSRRVNVLDPRSEGPLLLGTVRIPADQLSRRVYELPEPGACVLVCVGPGFDEAVAFLQARGHEVSSCSLPDEVDIARNRLWSPPAALEAFEDLLGLGDGRSALCLGCGCGREAIWLAERGWTVTAIDRLPDSLDQGRCLEARYPGIEPIEWLQLDLKKEPMPDRRFDLTTMFCFMERALLGQLSDHLAPGGLALMETFSEEHRLRTGKPGPTQVLRSDEDIPGLEIRSCDVIESASRQTVRIFAKLASVSGPQPEC